MTKLYAEDWAPASEVKKERGSGRLRTLASAMKAVCAFGRFNRSKAAMV